MSIPTPDPSPAAPPSPEHERHFGVEELFFSTTDRKGIIQAGNDVFVRVSGYDREELVGRPHNLIRHPDTPRCAFQVFWDHLERGEPVAAYVKNRAKDGGYYWVLAVAVPVDGGYLSVRIKPTTPVFAAAQGIYAELRALEQRIEGPTGRKRKAAIEASTARLGELLQAAGFADYDAFMRHALAAELRARHAILGASRPSRPVDASAAESDYHGELRRLGDACAAAHEFLCGLFAELDDYQQLNTRLAEKARFVLDLAADVRLFAINAVIVAARLGPDGVALGAVAHLVGGSSAATGDVTRASADGIARAIRVLQELEFEISVATLQSEMAMFFTSELRAGAEARGANRDLDADVSMFLDSLATAIEGVIRHLGSLAVELAELGPHLKLLRKSLDALRILEVNGRIEASRIGHDGELQGLFADIAGRVSSARSEVTDLRALVARSDANGLQAARERLRPHLARLHAAGQDPPARAA